jgi:hypothetical protein
VKTLKDSSDANWRGKSFKVLLVIGIVVLIATSCVTQIQIHPVVATNIAMPRVSTTPSPWITYTPSPVWTVTPPSTGTATAFALSTEYAEASFRETATASFVAAHQPPLCTFPLSQTTTAESLPENYAFSEPKVMLTDDNAGFYIFGWTPDSQQALIIRDVGKNQYEEYQSIELFNPRTIKVHVYAKRAPGEFIYTSPPLWLAGLDAMVFDESIFLSASYDSNGVIVPGSAVIRQLLWLSQGNPMHLQALEDATLSGDDNSRASKSFSSVVVNPDGNEMMYMRGDGKQLYQREISQNSLSTVRTLPFDLTQWSLVPYSYMTAWRPNSSQIFFYSNDNFWYHNFLLDENTGEVCELNFGGAAYLARWSPNGRYLAVIKAPGPMFPLWQVYDMSVLDTVTGKIYPIEAAQLKPPAGTRLNTDIIDDFAWGPDNHHLAIIGSAVSFGTSPPPSKTFLYLVDFLSEKTDVLFPSTQFYTAYSGTSLAWSPDGSKILALCEDSQDLCLISVKRTQ